MADHQRIHPDNVEAPPSVPLAKHDSLRSEQGTTIPVQQFPPFRRTIPVVHSKPPRKGSCCCRCFCWTTSLIIILLILIAASGGILYVVFQPKLPKYSIDRLSISNLQLNLDMSLSTGFDVTITARNPNKKIGIYYEEGSHISVWYNGTSLCSGSLPKFYQGHQNTTVLNVTLSGRAQFGSTLMNALREQQQIGRIPLDLKVDVPVRVKFGRLKMRKVEFFVRCNLVVDSLSANNLISIKTSSCKFKLRL